MDLLSLDILKTAHARIIPYIHQTPVYTCHGLNELAGAEIFFKCENFQKVGAFKARGGLNAVLSMDENSRERGITTHSSGNHAQAIAFAARTTGTNAIIVMPDNAPRVKIDAVKGYGAQIVFCESTLEARETTVQQVIEQTGACFIHPYNDDRIISGQATAALEFIPEVRHPMDYILAPVGGGGLLSGTALAAHFLSPDTRVIGTEPEGADDAYRSFKSGRLIPQTSPDTVADGLRTSLGERTFQIIHRLADDILTVSDRAIIEAMRLIWQRMKIVIEPSSAVPFAAVLKHRDKFAGQKIGIILSGGNVDLTNM